jgi:hypothetical protein
MHTRLLSFLSDIEKSLAAEDPAPSEGAWENTRTVNYHLGLARLTLGVRAAGALEERGTLLLQGYHLADGTPCLKVALAWKGSGAARTQSIFSKPGTNWLSAARLIAAEWLAGPPAAEETPASAAESLAAAGTLAAAG